MTLLNFRLICIIVFSVFVLNSCKEGTTSASHNQEQEELISNPITKFPNRGAGMMPVIDKQVANKAQKDAPTEMLSYLSSIIEEREDVDFIAVASNIHNYKKESEYFTYREVILRFPPGLVKKAEGKTRFYVYSLTNEEGDVYRRFEGIVPDVPKVKKMLEKWLNVEEKESKKAKATEGYYLAKSQCYQFDYGDQCISYYPDFDSWGLCEIDICGGGPPGEDPWPDDDDWDDICADPNINCEWPDMGEGGSGDGGNNGGNDSEDCDPNAIDPANGCEDPYPEPCIGDPVPDPEIAPTENQGIQGGRYGAARDNGRTHNGLDIKSDLNSPLYTPFTGEVYATGVSSTYGNYIIIKSNFGGNWIYILYAHLNDVNVSNGVSVNALDQIGKTGNSGNASGENIVPHVHIEVRTPVSGQSWNDWNTHNPENYLSTKFDSNGNPIPPNNCNAN